MKPRKLIQGSDACTSNFGFWNWNWRGSESKEVEVINEGAWGVPCDNVSKLRAACIYKKKKHTSTIKDHRDMG